MSDWIAGAFLRHREQTFLIGMILLYLLPIWVFQYFPSQDGPAHIYNAALINEFISPTHDVFQKYYQLNTNLDPTWFVHFILAVLIYVFDPVISEKIYLTFYVLMFVFSVRYALGAINMNARWLVFLIFPLIYNYILYMGFYANSVSYAMSFFVLGYWLRYSNEWKKHNLVLFGLLVFILYLFHIVSFAMTLGVLGIFIICALYNDLQTKNIEGRVSEIINLRIIYPFLSILPTFIFAGIFILSKESSYFPGVELWTRIKLFLSFDFIVSFQLLENAYYAIIYVFLILIPFVLFVIAKIKQRRIEKSDMFLIASFACVIVYLVAPEVSLSSPDGMSGGGFIVRRIMPFPYFLIILWFAAQSFSTTFRKSLITASLLFSVTILVVNMYKTAEIDEQIEEFLSAEKYIEPHTTILPLLMAKRGYTEEGNMHLTKHIDPFLHVTSRIATQRSLVLLDNYEARMGYFPMLYRDDYNPYRNIDGIAETLESGDIMGPQEANINFINYKKRTGGSIDYVLVWLGKKRIINEKNSQSIYDQLESEYERLFVSENELMELYRLK